MLTYSPEAVFFLTLFELVLSGLSFVTLLVIRYWEGAPSRARGTLIGACGLLAAGFAAHAVYYHLALSPPEGIDERYQWPLFAVEAIRLASSIAIVSALLVERDRRGRLKIFLAVAFAVVVGAAMWLPGAWGSAIRTIDPLTPMRIADLVILTTGTALAGTRGVRTLALAIFVAGRASAIAGALWPHLTELSWGAGHVLLLTALLLLAFTLERQSERRVLQYVLRFNLIFLLLAATLIVVLTEIARQQFVAFSAMQIRDVAEYARGHLLYQSRLGNSPDAILRHPDLVKQLVREFGRYPDLRRIQLELDHQAMSLEIDATGQIAQRFWTGDRPDQPRVAPADFLQALLLREPVLASGRPLGEVSLYHSIIPINVRIGRQMEVAFAVFTLFVLIGSAVTGILVHFADRTINRQKGQLATAQWRLLQMERLASVGAVADGVAHEINNPAGVLIARSDYLLTVMRGKPYAAEIQEDLDTIRRQAQRIAKTVSDLLSSSRRTRALHDAVDLSVVVGSAIKLVQPIVRASEVTFAFRGSGPVLVWGDRDRLEQVFINLLSNAAQAIPGRGDVTIDASVRPGGTLVDVVVTDTGVGIPPEQLPRVFDRFFTTKEAGAGSGLGLSIVHGIVSDHGGQISLASTPGKGTQFRLTLPACAPGSRPLPTLSEPQLPASIAGTAAGMSTSLAVERTDG